MENHVEDQAPENPEPDNHGGPTSSAGQDTPGHASHSTTGGPSGQRSSDQNGGHVPQRGILLGERHCSVVTRFTARAIDLILLFALFALGKGIALGLGAIIAIVYALFQDAMGGGQSVGKRLCGLRVLDSATEQSCTFQQSFLRNFPLGVGVFLLTFPLLWVFFVLLVLPVLCLEFYLTSRLVTGTRLGDLLGHTFVKEAEPYFGTGS